MENNANYAFVGALSTAIIVALLAFAWWFAGPSSADAVKSYNVVFTGTVSGIGVGTDVTFNGIRIGTVRTIELDQNDANRVLARVDVAMNAPVKADTKVLLGIAGLTGQGSVQFEGGTVAAGEPVIAQGETIPTLYAERSNFQSILDGVTTTVNGAASAVDRLNGFLDTNETKLTATVDNVQTFSAALASNSTGVETFLSSISDAGREIGPMASEIRGLSADLRGLIDAVPPEQITKLLGDVSSFTDTLAQNSGQIDQFFATTTALSGNLNELANGLRSSVAVLDRVTNEIEPGAVGRVIANIDKFSTTLGNNSDDIDMIVSNVNDLTGTLKGSATMIDGVISNINDVVTNVDGVVTNFNGIVDTVNGIVTNVNGIVSDTKGQGFFDEIAGAARSVRLLADQLNSSTAGIAAGVNNFTSRGLSEYTALAVDARSTLGRLDRVVRNLEANPQSLVFGGETVREYNKR